jgi:hypothetical protein
MYVGSMLVVVFWGCTAVCLMMSMADVPETLRDVFF